MQPRAGWRVIGGFVWKALHFWHSSLAVPHRRRSFFWPLRVIVGISLAVPAALFAYATWENARTIDREAEERIDHALDVLQEQALKSLQTVERAISETNEVMRGMSDEQIRAAEADLFLRLKRTQQALPQIEAIWAFDSKGHPLVSSTIYPVPQELNNSDRSYFAAHARTADSGTYIGEVVRARIGSLSFFVVSGRRVGAEAARFNGVIGITVMPDHFTEFYRKLTRGRDSFALVRADGTILARFPETRLDQQTQMGQGRELARAAKTNPLGGRFTALSLVDGLERRIGYRKVAGFPLYVTAGVETAALRAEFWETLIWRLVFGVPVMLGIFALSLYALRRAERFQQETLRREAAETALKQAQRLEAIGQLTGGVAHDFNNLLMVVSGNAERLKRFLPGDERPRKALEAIETAVKRGSDLTRQLLSFSRRQTHEARVVDLRERLPLIQTMLQSSLRGDIAVQVQVADDIWPTRVDLSEFELALLNLAVNARDAMPGGGTLSIVAGNETLTLPNAANLNGDFVVVSIADSGVGIAPEVVNRVFEPFFTTKDIGKGTGLGLSQVYGFAQQAGGTATIDSAPGSGTTVRLYLPRSRDAVHREAEPATPARLRERLHVLLVEDNAEVTHVTRGILEEAGHEVQTVANAPAAFALLREANRRIDVVLSDIVMPGGANGLDLARWVRQEFGDAMPVILATGYSDKAQAAADEGFIILRKPYDAIVLNEALIEAVRKGAREVA
jgi:two-component system NtrC family sensor kinase